MAQKQQENKGGGRGTSFDIAVLCVVFSKGRFFVFFVFFIDESLSISRERFNSILANE